MILAGTRTRGAGIFEVLAYVCGFAGPSWLIRLSNCYVTLVALGGFSLGFYTIFTLLKLQNANNNALERPECEKYELSVLKMLVAQHLATCSCQ